MAARTGFVVLFTMICAASPGAAQTPAPPAQVPQAVTIPRVDTPPRLEDYLDGAARPGDGVVTTFLQREPGDGVPASQKTETYLSYDGEHLYVVFVAHDDEPGKVRASLTKRESFGNDDTVGIALDTFHDRRRAYLFIVNPLGVQRDGISSEGTEHDDYSFDTLWQSEGRLTPFGYVVRMAIPFKSLRFPNALEQEWGIALFRSIERNNETSFWPYVTKRIASVGQQMATARGPRDISPGRNMQVIPYGAFTGVRFLDEAGPAYVTERDGRAGVDGKMVVKDAFTVDATFNPDFSQIESDEPQVTINQRFEVYFPEKRPFFIENASYFQTPINLFFSRRIADPQVGVRLTGKAAGWSIGGLAMDDRAPGQRLDPLDPAYGDRAGIGMVRFQRDLRGQSTIGVLATSLDFGSSESRVVSADGRYQISDTVVFTGQAAMSTYRSLEGESQSGPAVTVEIDRTGRNWGAFLAYEDISPEFRAPLGYVRRVDVRQLHPFVRYTWFPEKSAIVSIRPEVSGSSVWDHAGTLQDWEAGSELQVEFKGPSQVSGEYGESMERFEGVEFRKRSGSVQVETSWLKWLEASAQIEWGDDINYYPSEGIAPFLARSRGAEVSVTLKPLPQFRLDETYLFTRLTTPEALPLAPSQSIIVDNHIWRSRASYQFTRNLSLRAILDYASVLPDERLIDLELEKRFSADLLLTYQVNPWTAAYLGYTDGYGNVEIDPIGRDRLHTTDSAFHSMGRQVFFKISYLLRF